MMMNDLKGRAARVLARLIDAMNPEQDPALVQRREQELERGAACAGPYTRAHALARDEYGAMLAHEAPAPSPWARCIELLGYMKSLDYRAWFARKTAPASCRAA